MSKIGRIRTEVFQLNQAAFATVAGVSQATVSRWESGKWEPNRDELERIRQRAIADGKLWNDAWFFDPPSVPAREAAE